MRAAATAIRYADLNSDGHVDAVDVDALVAEMKNRTETIDILMNNAGITWGAPLGQFPFDAWNKVMDVNVAGLFDLTQKLLPMLIASGSDAKSTPNRTRRYS